MARHRSIRAYQYNDDLEDCDVYGHSVEDDFGVSPATVAQFTFQRGNYQLSHYVDEPLKEAHEEEEEDNPSDCGVSAQELALNELDCARLSSCLDEMRNVAGDSFSEPVMVQAVINNNYDLEKALNSLFLKNEKSSSKNAASVPSRLKEKRPEMESDCRVSLVPKIAKMTVSGKQTLGFETPSKSNDVKPEVTDSSPKSNHVEDSDTPSREANSTHAVPKQSSAEMNEETVVRANTPSKPPGKRRQTLDIKAELEKRQGGKQLINLVVIGHVDAGKSTLMGHLLFLLGNVNKRVMHRYEQESKKAGKASFAYAWVLDETGEERERGVTIDVGMTKFETQTKVVSLMDAPGHKDFIPNMITGAAQADVAVLVVNVTTGEFEAGFEAGGQTREHALLVRSLGVTQLAVAMNKMDTVDWSQDRFDSVATKIGQFLKQAGFKESEVAYIPTSGLSGENLVTSSTDGRLTAWYNGSCLLEQIDAFKSPKRSVDKPCRLCVSDVFKEQGSGFCVSGKIEAGYMQLGDRLLVMPANETCVVKVISLHDEAQDWAAAGDHVTLTVTGMDITKVTTGSVLCDVNNPVKVCTRLLARILLFNIDVPVTKGFPLLLHYQTVSEPATIKHLIGIVNKSNGEIVKRKPKCLLKGQNAIVELRTQRPICVELYKEFRELGRFMLRYGGLTVAAGVVTEVRLDSSD
uniref:HBS1-like protein isoform X2 n=1 Tax=Myxine glutinosa TaxID=7769 RepID=UPI00358FF03A